MITIPANLHAVKLRIDAACAAARRDPATVALLAVSKTWPAAAIRTAAAAGQRDFGENYVQEARAKQAELADLPLEWHFIGPLQSNKTRAVAEHFDWVHSVERLKIANASPRSVRLSCRRSRSASRSMSAARRARAAARPRRPLRCARRSPLCRGCACAA